MPAIEYGLYPYREATRRQLTVAYRVGASHITYRDTTIYDEIEQSLPEHTFVRATDPRELPETRARRRGRRLRDDRPGRGVRTPGA